MTSRMMSVGLFELAHRIPQPSCDLFSEEVVTGRLGKCSRGVLGQVVDLLKFLSFLRLVLSALR